MRSLRHTKPTGSLKQDLFFRPHGDLLKSFLPSLYLNPAQGQRKERIRNRVLVLVGSGGVSFFFFSTCQPSEFQAERFSEVDPDSLIFSPLLPYPSRSTASPRHSVRGHMVEPEAPGSPFKPAGRLKLSQQELGARKKLPDISKEWSGICKLFFFLLSHESRGMRG